MHQFFLSVLHPFSPHRLTSHLWISHGLADNSWSPFHGPTAFNMNYKKASQAYQWMTDWICMAWGQRGVRAQWLRHSVDPRTGNTSVAQGRLFHQHNVWHCLRQMLSWDVLLTFTPFGWETQVRRVNTGEVQDQKKLLHSVRYPEQLKTGRGKKRSRVFFLGISCCFMFCPHTRFLTLSFKKQHKKSPAYSCLSLSMPQHRWTATKTASLLWSLPVSLQIWHGHQIQTT